jgi:hypothetical protein
MAYSENPTGNPKKGNAREGSLVDEGPQDFAAGGMIWRDSIGMSCQITLSVGTAAPDRGGSHAGRTSLFLLPVSIELLEKRDKVIGLLFVLQTSIDHLGAWNLRFWILDIFSERRFIPSDARILVGIGI